MTRMLDMIRQSEVPANLMRSAAKGALALPAAEMVEILVHLAHHPIFGEQARMTLAAWDEKSALEIAGNPATPVPVLEYLVDPKNLRPQLFPTLLRNPSVPEMRLHEFAESASRELAKVMLTSERILHSESVLLALQMNPHLTVAEHEAIKTALASVSSSPENATLEDVLETPEMREFIEKHAAEIEAEQHKEFELFRDDDSGQDELNDLLGIAKLDSKDEKAAHAGADKHANPEEEKKLSTLQRLARMTVGERVQRAMKGNKDERFILIRDGSKVVSLAVLESPKVTDTEAEMFAGMKNVQEAVLRGIVTKRKYMKNYAVIRALVNNPRCPLDLGLPLLPHLLVMDLKHLSMNKNVSETLRKLAGKLFVEKTVARKKE